jgi:hypothetical protein
MTLGKKIMEIYEKKGEMRGVPPGQAHGKHLVKRRDF